MASVLFHGCYHFIWGVYDMRYENELISSSIKLRNIELADCTKKYVQWLNDPMVNKYLETRFVTQTMQSIYSYVDDTIKSDSSFLFAIISNDHYDKHVGNIKLGPIHPQYLYADMSCFIGDKDYWGRGVATEAMMLITGFAFSHLKLHRVQSGVFEENVGSIKALEKAGFECEGRLRKQLRTHKRHSTRPGELVPDSYWQDLLFYGIVNDNEY